MAANARLTMAGIHVSSKGNLRGKALCCHQSFLFGKTRSIHPFQSSPVLTFDCGRLNA